MRKAFLSWLMVAIALLTVCSNAQAQGCIIDNTTATATGTTSLGQFTTLAQSFTTTCNGNLGLFVFKGPRTGVQFSINISIIEGDGLTGTLLYFKDRATAFISNGSYFIVIDPLAVTQGSTYTVRLTQNGVLPILFSNNNNNSYPNGTAYLNGNELTNTDLLFSAQIDQPCTPVNTVNNLAICSSELPYFWNGTVFNGPGSQTISSPPSPGGCINTTTLNLSVKPDYIINGIAGIGGSISDAGNKAVCEGSAFNYSFIADNGYRIADVLVDGASVGAVSSYTFTNVTSNHTISVSFALNCTPTTSTTDSTICASALPLAWNGQSITAPGTYTATVQNVGGCDSVATLNLTVNNNPAPLSLSATPSTICLGSSTVLNAAPSGFQGDYDLSKWQQGGGLSGYVYNYGAPRFIRMSTDLTEQAGVMDYTLNNLPASGQLTFHWYKVTRYNADPANFVFYYLNNGIWHVIQNSAGGSNNYGENVTINVTKGSDFGFRIESLGDPDYYDIAVDGYFEIVAAPAPPVAWFTTATGGSAFSTNTSTSVTPSVSGTASYYAEATDPASGCVSSTRDVVTVTVNQSTSSNTDSTICASALPLAWNGQSITAPGTYTATLQNVGGCDSVATLNLNVNPAIGLTSLSSNKPAVCGGESVQLYANGVTGKNALVRWYLRPQAQGGVTLVGTGTSITTNLGARRYYAYITTDCGESMEDSIVVGQALTATYAVNNVNCFGAANGSIGNIQITGGTAPYEISTAASSGFAQTTVLAGLKAAPYRIFIKDAAGCTGFTDIIRIDQPEKMQTTFGAYPLTCFNAANGAISKISTVNGTAPYTYTLNATTAYLPVTFFSNLKAGSYRLFVSDNTGCKTFTDLISITQPTAINISFTKTDASCVNPRVGSITVTGATGGSGSGYQFALSPSGPFTANMSFNGLRAGNYRVYCRDGNGCVSFTAVITIAPCPAFARQAASPTSLNESGSNEVMAYPNPTNGRFTMAVSSKEAMDAAFVVSNSMGQPISLRNVRLNKGNNNLQFDLSNQPVGLYFIRITTKDGVVVKPIEKGKL